MKDYMAFTSAETSPEASAAPAVPDVSHQEFMRDLMLGLAQKRKSISPKYFYDARGSQLFDSICCLPEYYPTRTELAILQKHARAIADHIGSHAEIVEFGAGSMEKVRILIDVLHSPQRYVPIDISAEHLLESANKMRMAYPALEVEPIVADYSQIAVLPPDVAPQGRRVGFFPGSTLGNFEPNEALQFLQMCATALAGGAMLLGVDLVKSPDRLHAAYNDSAGITADFNRNLLVRANRELGTNFQPDQFAHSAFYNAPYQRIEMHLVSTCQQTVNIGTAAFAFAEGETLHTENSYKFTADSLHQLAHRAGFKPGPVWTDDENTFSLLWLDAPPRSTK